MKEYRQTHLGHLAHRLVKLRDLLVVLLRAVVPHRRRVGVHRVVRRRVLERLVHLLRLSTGHAKYQSCMVSKCLLLMRAYNM